MTQDVLNVAVLGAAATLSNASEWWSGEDAGLIGAIGGTAAGLCGAALGCAVPMLAHRGKARRAVVGAQIGAASLGVATLTLGAIALALGQPQHVWYPPLLCGLVLGSVMGGLLPVTLGAYRRAEARRLEAEQLRREG